MLIVLTMSALCFLILIVIGLMFLDDTVSGIKGLATCFLCLFGMMALVVLWFGLPSSGSPIPGLPNPGSYKVGYVYVAGDNVNVGVEKFADGHEGIVHYQFLKSSVDGEIPEKPGQLSVTEVGNGQIGKWKKVRFEKLFPEAPTKQKVN